MKFSLFQRKSVSLIVLVAFVTLLHFYAAPAQAAPVKGKAETTMAQGESGGPNFIEEENEGEYAVKKAKKFPWLIVGLGVVAIGVVIFILTMKPKYTLTVTLGTGCTGTPAVTTKYKKGTVVSYNYTPLAGYGNLQVKLDGVAVPATGTVTMDKDKALTVSAELLDIRGTWHVDFTGSSAVDEFSIVFSGTTTSGTWKLISYTDTGTYTVNGENVSFVFDGAPWTFTGKFQTNNKMSGNHAWPAIGLSGTWTAIRQGTTAGMNPSLQTTHFEESILKKLLNK